MAKQKVEDMQWLAELAGLVPQVIEKHGRSSVPFDELVAEIVKVKQRIATHDYAPLEARRQASIARLGKESVYW